MCSLLLSFRFDLITRLYISEKANYADSPLEDSPESLLQEASKIEPDDVFINGNEQLESNQTDKDENSEHFAQIKEARYVFSLIDL